MDCSGCSAKYRDMEMIEVWFLRFTNQMVTKMAPKHSSTPDIHVLVGLSPTLNEAELCKRWGAVAGWSMPFKAGSSKGL